MEDLHRQITKTWHISYTQSHWDLYLLEDLKIIKIITQQNCVYGYAVKCHSKPDHLRSTCMLNVLRLLSKHVNLWLIWHKSVYYFTKPSVHAFTQALHLLGQHVQPHLLPLPDVWIKAWCSTCSQIIFKLKNGYKDAYLFLKSWKTDITGPLWCLSHTVTERRLYLSTQNPFSPSRTSLPSPRWQPLLTKPIRTTLLSGFLGLFYSAGGPMTQHCLFPDTNKIRVCIQNVSREIFTFLISWVQYLLPLIFALNVSATMLQLRESSKEL